jgi:hypothetical protein
LLNPNGGNVGIGVTNPSDILQVKGAGRASADGAVIANFTGTGSNASINIINNTNGGQIGYKNNGAGNLSNTFYVTTGAGTVGSGIVMDNGGNVGIGLTNPQAKLEVAGTLKVNAGSNIGSISLGDSDTRIRTTSSFASLWETWNGSGYFTALSVDGQNGRVGVGGAAGNYNIVVADNPNAARLGTLTTGRSGGEYPSVGYAVRYGGTPGSYTYDVSDYAAMIRFGTSGQIQTFTATNGTAGNAISFTAGPYVASAGTSWTSSSDVRLKQNIETLSVLDRLGNYRAVSFNWRQGGRHDVGVVAQELYEIFPELVVTAPEGSGQYWGVNYDKLGALALQAVKELNQKVDLNASTTLSDIANATSSMFAMINSTTTTQSIVSSVLTELKADIVNGITHFIELAVDNLRTKKLAVGQAGGPSGITLYDEDTGAPYCFKIKSGATLSIPGECGSAETPIYNPPIVISTTTPISDTPSAEIATTTDPVASTTPVADTTPTSPVEDTATTTDELAPPEPPVVTTETTATSTTP